MLNRATRFASTTWSIPIGDLELSLEKIVGGMLIDPASSSEMKSDSARILRSWERIIRRVTEAFGDSSLD